MAIGRWFGTRSRGGIVGGVEWGSVCGAVSAGKVAAKDLEIVSLRAFRGFWTDGCGGVRTARPSCGSEVTGQEESKKALRENSSTAVNRCSMSIGVPQFGHFQEEGSCGGVVPAA